MSEYLNKIKNLYSILTFVGHVSDNMNIINMAINNLGPDSKS